MSATRKFIVLAALYFAQGLPFGFFSHAVPTLLNRTHPPEIVGLSSLLALPWGLKFLIAPFVDLVDSARFGRRKLVIVPLQIAAFVTLVLIGASGADDKHLAPLVAGFFLVSLFSATQDAATDALALDLLDETQRGLGGSIQAGAYRAGMIAGGGGVLALVDHIGFREAFFGMGGLVLACTVPTVGLREPASTRRVAAERGRKLAAEATSLVTSFFKRADAGAIVLLTVSFKLGDALAAGMVTRWFVKEGLTLTDIALSRGIVGGVAAIVGALAGAPLVRSLGRRRALLFAAIAQGLAVAMYVALDVAHPAGRGLERMPMLVYHAASATEHLAGGLATALLFTRMMDVCRDDARATDFTLQSCLLVAITGLGLVGSGFVTGALGLRGLFIVATIASVVGCVGVARTYREPSPTP